MPINSYVHEEGPGRGRGHISHGNGKGVGHTKHADEAMSDGVYTLQISGINNVNHGPGDQLQGPTTLADGTTMATEARFGSVTIANNAPSNDGDTCALRLETDSAAGRLRVHDSYDANNMIKLGDLDTLKFDYYIQSSDRTDVTPVIRLIIDADGNLATTTDRGELVFEWAYQGMGATTTGSWQVADLVADDWTAWQRSFGVNRDQIVNMTAFSDWADADGFTPAGGLHFDANSVIMGWSIALGSGNGTNVMFLDDLQVGGVTYEFG